MNIYLKKTLSVLLAVLMLVTTVPAISFAAEDAAADTMTVFINDAAGWGGTMHIYAFDSDFTSGSLGQWPGTPMHAVEGESGVYSYNIPSDTYGIVFNNSGTNQSSDLFFPVEGNCYNNSTNTWSTVSYPGNVLKDVPLTVDVTGLSGSLSFGSGYSHNDEDGYIITGENANIEICFYSDAEVTFDNLTAHNVRISNSSDVVLTLKGENEIRSGDNCPPFSIGNGYKDSSTLTINGTDEDILNAYTTFSFVFSGNSSGSQVTVNGGTINLEAYVEGTTSYTDVILTNYTQNGGTVTVKGNGGGLVSADEFYLNGGTLELINTSTSNPAVRNEIYLSKGALLKINSASGYLGDQNDPTVLISSDAPEGTCVFANYEKDTENFRYFDVTSAIPVGKAYGEFKAVEHTHILDKSVCEECGFVCKHDTEDGICGVCNQYVYTFVHEPTLEEPYVQLNDGTDASYQWYKVTGISEISDSSDILSWDDFHYSWVEDAQYSSAKGWKGATIEYAPLSLETRTEKSFFVREYKKGDKLSLEFSIAPVDVQLKAEDYDFSRMFELDGRKAVVTVPEDGLYGIMASFVDNKDCYMRAYIGEAAYTPIDGETDGTLKNAEAGGYYACKATTKSGEELVSFIVPNRNVITHQPTEKEPYVEVKLEEATSYQWLTVGEEEVELTNESNNVSGANYSTENGWTVPDHSGDSYEAYLYVDLKSGDTVKFVFDEPVDAVYIHPEWAGIGSEYTIDVNGTEYTYTASAADEYCLKLESVNAVRAYMNGVTYTELSDETSKELKNITYGKKYVCDVTFADGSKERSDVLDLSYRITHQPTVEELYVEVNNDEGASYQWYSVVGGEEVTDKNADLATADIIGFPSSYVALEGSYSFEKGWSPMCIASSDEITLVYFMKKLKAGDTVYAEFSEAPLEAFAFILETDQDNPISVNGKEAVFTAESDGTYILGASAYDVITVKASAGNIAYTELPDETSKELKNKVFGNKYVCDVTFPDSTKERSEIADLSYRITHQPTEEEPYVEISNEEGASYQWYAKEKNTVEITDETVNASFADLGVPEGEDIGGAYDSENGWTCDENGFYFVVWLNKGETLTTEFSQVPSSTHYFYSSVKGTVENDGEFPPSGITAEKDGYYCIAAADGGTLKAYGTMENSKEIEGEISKKLKNHELGKKYLCKVTYADGTSEMSEAADFPYRITHQPKATEPYIELNSDEGASYQWYEVEKEDIGVTSDNAQAATDGTDNVGGVEYIVTEAAYNPEKGTWSPAYYEYTADSERSRSSYFFTVSLEKGDLLVLETDKAENFNSFKVGLLDGNRSIVDLTDGNKGIYNVVQDGVYVISATEVVSESAPANAKATIKKDKNVKAENETESTLKNPGFSKKYFCEVKAKDGSFISSDSFVYRPAITSQPSEEKLSVDINDEGAAYQWYTVTGEREEITDENASSIDLNNEGIPAFMMAEPVSTYSKDSGWSPAYTTKHGLYYLEYFSKVFQKGEKLEVEFSDTLNEAFLYGAHNDEELTLEVTEGKASIIIPESGEYWLAAETDGAVNAKAYIDKRTFTPIEGAISGSLDDADDGRYACEVTFADGTKEMSEDVNYNSHKPLVIDISTDVIGTYFVGKDVEGGIYDEDGIIFKGSRENVAIIIKGGCDLTFENLTVNIIRESANDDTVNITLKGINEVKHYFGFYKADLIINGDENAVLKFGNINTGGNDGTVTLNGGNLIINYETDDTSPTLNCETLTINGGSITASNNFYHTLSCPVMLNGGALNIISTAPEQEAMNGAVTMKKGALLTISTESKILSDWYGTKIEIAEGEDENSSLFVRYDKESAFVPVSNIREGLEGKLYAEIKVDSHTHSYENGKCVCGYECLHENIENKKCTVCGIDCPHKTIADGKCVGCGADCPHDSYTKGRCDKCNAACPHKNITDNICNDCQAEFKGFQLYLGDILVTSSNYSDILGSADSGATASYNPETNTLTLENFNLSGETGICANGSLNIELKGKNTIAVSGEGREGISIVGQAEDVKLVIGGDGELEISSATDDGIYLESWMNCEAEIKDSVKIKITAETDGIQIYGAYAGLTVMNNARVEITAVSEGIRLGEYDSALLVKDNGEIIINGDDEGIYLYNEGDSYVTFTDNAKVSITTTDEEGIYVYSDEGDATVTVSGNADVHIDADEEGVLASDVIVTGGTLDASGTGAYEGISAENLEISGGIVKATGGAEASAISAKKIKVKGGSLEAKTASPDLPACSVAPDLSEYETEKKLYASVNADGSDLVEYKAEDHGKYKYFSFQCVHKEEALKGFEATCSKTGLTDGSHCAFCGVIFTAQNEIPKVNHIDANSDGKCDFGCGTLISDGGSSGPGVLPEEPTTKPSGGGSTEPTTKPSGGGSTEPTTKPSGGGSTEPTTKPSGGGSTEPTTKPSGGGSTEPTTKPSGGGSTEPTTKPSGGDSTEPTTKPSGGGSTEPTTKPSGGDSTEPTTKPSDKPTTEHKHTVVVIPAVKATYKKSGKTEGKKCSECGEILVKQKKVARKKLKKVTKLKVKKTSSTYIKLSWSKVTGADSYKVYYSTNGKKWKSVKVKKNSATIKKLKSGTQYRFKVRAFAGKYYGTASKIVKKTTKVKKPTLSSVKSSKKKTALVTWKKVTNANGYVVEYSTSKKFTKKTTKTVKIKKGKTVKTTLKKLKSGKKYYVRIKAYKTVNKKAVYGAYSKVKTVKVK